MPDWSRPIADLHPPGTGGQWRTCRRQSASFLRTFNCRRPARLHRARCGHCLVAGKWKFEMTPREVCSDLPDKLVHKKIVYGSGSSVVACSGV